MRGETKMDYLNQAKKHMKLGVVSMAGMGAMGAMGNIPGMPAQAKGITGTVGAGLTLANVGQLSETGMGMAKSLGGSTKKKSSSKVVNKILGL